MEYRTVLRVHHGGALYAADTTGYLIAVEKYGSISRAARELYTSQSSISTSIKTLETELGLELLRRGTKGVHITAEGQYILENAKIICPAYG